MRLFTTLMALSVLTTACDDGAGGSDATEPAGTGVVSAPWDLYCTITLTEDVAESRGFGDPYVLPAGSTWLLGYLSRDRDRVEILHIDGGAVVGIDLDVDPDALPFESSCDLEAAESRYGVFADVTLYADEGLTTPLCTLEDGTTVPTDSGGFALTGDLDFFGPNTYEIVLGGLAERCDGAEVAYLEADSMEVGGVDRSPALPLRMFLGPRD